MNKLYHDPLNPSKEFDLCNSHCKEVLDSTFITTPNDKPLKTLVCKTCGGKEFNVGKGSYWTQIKCVKCGYEVCVHEG